jgi:hypothetical protein
MYKLRKVCYSLAKLYARSVYLHLFVWRGVKFIKHLKEGTQDTEFGNFWHRLFTK